MRKVIVSTIVVSLLVSLAAVPIVMAKGPNGPAGNSNVGHINIVEKDPDTWEIILDAGKLTYQVSGTTLRVVLNAKGLEPGLYYQCEVVSKGADGLAWDVLNPDNYNMFYAQANGGGNIHADFCLDIGDATDIEVNVKNAEWAPLLNPSEYGVPEEWVYNPGQGYDYEYYSEAEILDTP